MLYKLKQDASKTTFVRLNATSMADEGLLESQMEQWLADNPTAVLPEAEGRVLVISQETPFKNVTDILAIDSQGNLLIIEVKRGQSPRDVIAQAPGGWWVSGQAPQVVRSGRSTNRSSQETGAAPASERGPRLRPGGAGSPW